ncbi:hypothetical protein [Curtobacterium sp. SORGH_AS_0776]|uniref:hypothetical protein n=1 Tax=Curtobacterium sp. SORGH_AS_0776 TaxID=3041798 RepID=UPI00286CF0F8|nr:hypothetical protein [Curtobacterium sp. SORGH_AS_0776]
MSSVVIAKNVASPSTAMPTIEPVVTVIGRVCVGTAEVRVVVVDTGLTSSLGTSGRTATTSEETRNCALELWMWLWVRLHGECAPPVLHGVARGARGCR